jgi:hypothetical protein
VRRFRDSYYYATQEGAVYSAKTNRFLKPRPDAQGYLRLALRINGKSEEHLVHRIIAECFLEDFNPDLTINHIDGNKSNNHIANLECVTQRENNLHAFLTGLNPIRTVRKIVQFSPDGVMLKAYDTVSDASKETDINPGSISYCLRGITKHAGGFVWRYA